MNVVEVTKGQAEERALEEEVNQFLAAAEARRDSWEKIRQALFKENFFSEEELAMKDRKMLKDLCMQIALTKRGICFKCYRDRQVAIENSKR